MDADSTLLRAYLDGTLPVEELPRFEAWLHADPEHLRRLVLSSAMEAQLDQAVSDRVGTDEALIERPAISDQLGEELVAAYLAGDLAEAELVRLQQWLQYDSHRLRRMMLDAAFEYDLHQQTSARVESDRYEPSTDQTPLRLPTSGVPLSDRRPRDSMAWAITSYVAAGVLLAAALLLWIAFPPSSQRAPADVDRTPAGLVSPSPTVAPPLVAETGGFRAILRGADCRIDRDGRSLSLHGSLELASGDRVQVTDQGHAELQLSDGSHLLLDAGSELTWYGRRGIQLDLNHGQLRVAAAEQAERPLRIRTGAAMASVLGTVFTLETDGVRTLLQVHEGEVELVAGAQRLAVRAGAEAIADGSGLHPLRRRSNWLGADLPGLGSAPAELLPFVDLMRYARPWSAGYDEDLPEDQRRGLEVDDQGWITRLAPGQRASTVILHSGSYPSGVYTCHFEGDGLIEFGYGANIIRSERGRLEVDVTSLPHGLVLHVVETDPDDPIRNIRLVMPGFETTFRDEPFNPTFVAALRGIGVLRAHTWTETHGDGWLGWQDRRRPGDGPGLSGSSEPVAVEDLLHLVALLDCDLWLTAPHNADDGYLRNLAQLVHARLPLQRRCYLEYSSEIWNGLYPRVQWCISQGLEHGYQGGAPGIAFANARSEALWSAFESATGGERELLRVLSYNDVDYFRDHQQAYGQAFERADALAVYGGIRGAFAGELGVEGLAAADRERLLQMVRPMAQQAEAAIDDLARLRQRYGKRILAYSASATFWADEELGIASSNPISQRAGQIASDPAVAPLLGSWLRQWRRRLGDVAIIPLSGDYARELRADTPGHDRWIQSPTGPSWWTLHRYLEPIAPFPPSVVPVAPEKAPNDF